MSGILTTVLFLKLTGLSLFLHLEKCGQIVDVLLLTESEVGSIRGSLHLSNGETSEGRLLKG